MTTLQFNDHQSHAGRLRNRAEECRTLAEIVGNDASRLCYIQLAEAYERLAEHEDVMPSHARIEDVLGTQLQPEPQRSIRR